VWVLKIAGPVSAIVIKSRERPLSLLRPITHHDPPSYTNNKDM
jgi:hypothetical protein